MDPSLASLGLTWSCTLGSAACSPDDISPLLSVALLAAAACAGQQQPNAASAQQEQQVAPLT